MDRIWQIKEQVLFIPQINYTMQFGSVHTDELNAGNPAPEHDREIWLRMWDPSGNRCIKMTFDRNGLLVRSEIDDGTPMPIVMGGPGEATPSDEGGGGFEGGPGDPGDDPTPSTDQFAPVQPVAVGV